MSAFEEQSITPERRPWAQFSRRHADSSTPGPALNRDCRDRDRYVSFTSIPATSEQRAVAIFDSRLSFAGSLRPAQFHLRSATGSSCLSTKKGVAFASKESVCVNIQDQRPTEIEQRVSDAIRNYLSTLTRSIESFDDPNQTARNSKVLSNPSDKNPDADANAMDVRDAFERVTISRTAILIQLTDAICREPCTDFDRSLDAALSNAAPRNHPQRGGS
jgi:hypothetical protein